MLSLSWLLADAATLVFVVIAVVFTLLRWYCRTLDTKSARTRKVLAWHASERAEEELEEAAIRRMVRADLFPRALKASVDIAVDTRPLPDALVAAVEMTSLRAVS